MLQDQQSQGASAPPSRGSSSNSLASMDLGADAPPSQPKAAPRCDALDSYLDNGLARVLQMRSEVLSSAHGNPGARLPLGVFGGLQLAHANAPQ